MNDPKKDFSFEDWYMPKVIQILEGIDFKNIRDIHKAKLGYDLTSDVGTIEVKGSRNINDSWFYEEEGNYTLGKKGSALHNYNCDWWVNIVGNKELDLILDLKIYETKLLQRIVTLEILRKYRPLNLPRTKVVNEWYETLGGWVPLEITQPILLTHITQEILPFQIKEKTDFDLYDFWN